MLILVSHSQKYWSGLGTEQRYSVLILQMILLCNQGMRTTGIINPGGMGQVTGKTKANLVRSRMSPNNCLRSEWVRDSHCYWVFVAMTSNWAQTLEGT